MELHEVVRDVLRACFIDSMDKFNDVLSCLGPIELLVRIEDAISCLHLSDPRYPLSETDGYVFSLWYEYLRADPDTHSYTRREVANLIMLHYRDRRRVIGWRAMKP